MLEISFELQGGDKLKNILDVAVDKMKDLTQPMQEALELIKKHADENFSKKSSDTGGVWSLLSASTQKARANRWGYYKNTPNNP
ncbi:MAG: hypothetical protein LBU27_06160 [Candidatus Peribacteria bacterium]|jgi:hypothetical protein|nr:hypothetical protein [Candidatus Peribacteria bacterium]